MSLAIDALGPYKTLRVSVPALGLEGVLVVDNVAAGPAIGGLRMAPDVTEAECARLARAMTLKNACAGLPHGGGKSVLVGDPKMDAERKERWIRAFASALAGEEYILGPDMGTNEQCMGWARDEIGRAVGLPRALGGIPLDEIGATGWGLTHAIEVALARSGRSLDGARIAVQGFGAVGQHAARFLGERGAVMVAAADSTGTVHDPGGLDVATLRACKAEGRSVVDAGLGERLAGDAILDVECEVWIPAARPDVINSETASRLRAGLVAPGANIAVTADASRWLHEHGILCLPDFVVNAGGVICAAQEYHGAGERAAMAEVEDRVRRNTEEVLDRAGSGNVTPTEAAMALARERVEQAMSTRRWGIF